MKITINKKQIGFWLPNLLFKDLKKRVDEYNELGLKPKLNLIKTAYILNLLYHIPFRSKDKYSDGWIPICSTYLKSIKNYKTYINFLKNNGFMIEHWKDYSTTANRCKRYKIGGNYGSQVIKHTILSDDSHFVKNMNSFKIDRMRSADERCTHLTEWLNPELITIDSVRAISYIRKAYSGKGNIGRRNKRMSSIASIENKYWTYSREGKDDRLHSVLTSLPKDLRKYIKYNGEALIGLDIKNSQPFIFASILNQLIKPNINKLNGYMEGMDNNKYSFIMCDLYRNTLNKYEIQLFINEVLDGTFYESYGDILYKEGVISEDVKKQCYFTNTIRTSIKSMSNEKFDNRRQVAKQVIMQTLFSSEKYHAHIIKVFEKYYPEVYKVSQLIKKDKDKSFFPVLLQATEANCILDYCTKRIANKHPEMPLLTIHDSIITTAPYQEILEQEFPKLLSMYFGLLPKLGIEFWEENLSNAS
jgi:hypothetical protein